MTLWILILQFAMKLLPILYQLKIIRDQAELKELQRRFEVAVQEAEKGALDSVRLREQHQDNVDRLRSRWDEIKKGNPDPATEKPTSVVIKAPATFTPTESFVVEVIPPQPGADLFADDWRMYTLGNTSPHRVLLQNGGERKLRVVRAGVELAAVMVKGA